MSRDKGKKLIYVSEDLIDEIARIAKNKGVSIGKLVEDCLRQTVHVNAMGFDPGQVADLFTVMQAQRILGGVFAPSDVLSYLTEKVYQTHQKELQTKWYDSGVWNGKFLKEKFEHPVEAFRRFLELSRWDLNEVEVKELGGLVKVRCVSTVLTTEMTDLLSKFIEGVLNGLGYKVEKVDSVKGLIFMEAKR